MNRLDCIIALGFARIDNAVEFSIWRRSTTVELTGDPNAKGLETLLVYRPHYPERCPGCDCDPILNPPKHLERRKRETYY